MPVQEGEQPVIGTATTRVQNHWKPQAVCYGELASEQRFLAVIRGLRHVDGVVQAAFANRYRSCGSSRRKAREDRFIVARLHERHGDRMNSHCCVAAQPPHAIVQVRYGVP
jgi:hypothetical protein